MNCSLLDANVPRNTKTFETKKFLKFRKNGMLYT